MTVYMNIFYECNDIVWLLLMSLNKVLKEKDKLRDLNSSACAIETT